MLTGGSSNFKSQSIVEMTATAFIKKKRANTADRTSLCRVLKAVNALQSMIALVEARSTMSKHRHSFARGGPGSFLVSHT